MLISRKNNLRFGVPLPAKLLSASVAEFLIFPLKGKLALRTYRICRKAEPSTVTKALCDIQWHPERQFPDCDR